MSDVELVRRAAARLRELADGADPYVLDWLGGELRDRYEDRPEDVALLRVMTQDLAHGVADLLECVAGDDAPTRAVLGAAVLVAQSVVVTDG